ncbi:MAG: SspB family protein [Hyphomicrobium sp.]
MPAEPTIDYESLAQDALRGLVRTVLIQTAKTGLPGEHHFYISFDTTATGVVLSKRLKQKYPQEMTVVLQHRFWDLIVQDDRFEVKLTFDGIPERLVVPFAAIRVFFDPSVRYGLQFEDADLDPETGEPIEQPFQGRSTGRANGTRNTLRSTAPKKPRVPRKPKGEKRSSSANAASLAPARSPKGARTPDAETPAAETTPEAPAQSASKTDIPVAAEQTTADDAPRQDNAGAEVVSLDAFRKK